MTGLGVDFPDNDSGNATAELHAKTINHITHMPVLDLRDPENARKLKGTF